MSQNPLGGTPLLLITAPGGHEPERRYVLDLVVGEWLGFRYELETGTEACTSIRLAGDDSRAHLTLPDILLSTPDGPWLAEKCLPERPLARVGLPRSAKDRGDPAESVPVLFGDPAPDGLPWQAIPDGLAVRVDVLGGIFFLVSRLEELVRPERDEHGRFPVWASVAHGEGFLERPLADEYADLLFSAMRVVWPPIPRRMTPFRLRLTHDVDRPFAALGQPAWRIARSVAADVVLRREPRLAFRRARAVADARGGRVDRDPFMTFGFLMGESERHGLRSAFYVMAGNAPGDRDFRYRLSDSPLAPILREIHERGHEVGLHASYVSHGSPERLAMEAAALRDVCRTSGFEQPEWGVRQHYLRFGNPDTWRNQEAAGLAHDSTLGFAEHVGFRSGTCREYSVFDLVARHPLRLRERPLVAMDGSLTSYMHLEAGDASRRVRSLARTCRRHGGDAVLLYHNDAVAGARERHRYSELLEDLVRDGALESQQMVDPGGRR